MSDEILDSLVCGICLDYCNDAMETSCCHKLYCNRCIMQIDSKCPICRKKCHYTRSIVAQRMINSLPVECPYCKNKFTRDQIENHKLHDCSEAIVICPICKTESKTNEILNHIISVHQNEFKNKQEKIIELFDEEKSKLYQNTIEDLENSRRCIARLGSSGKYYCGKKLDGDPCLCCNGYCGPIEGCNCSACMELDIQSRRLPKGWLVNRDGFAARRADGKFYCGRCVLINVPYCDGYCGPNDGPNCDACYRLDKMTKSLTGRYRNLI